MGGAASSALEDDDEDFDILKFDALSLLDPKPEEVVTTEQLFEALEADLDPTAEPAEQLEASEQIEAENNLEGDNPEDLIPKEEADFFQ